MPARTERCCLSDELRRRAERVMKASGISQVLSRSATRGRRSIGAAATAVTCCRVPSVRKREDQTSGALAESSRRRGCVPGSQTRERSSPQPGCRASGPAMPFQTRTPPPSTQSPRSCSSPPTRMRRPPPIRRPATACADDTRSNPSAAWPATSSVTPRATTPVRAGRSGHRCKRSATRLPTPSAR